MVEQFVSIPEERHNQRYHQYSKIHFDNNIFHLPNK
jgi:hypothetical protein